MSNMLLLKDLPEDIDSYNSELFEALQHGKVLEFTAKWRSIWLIESEHKPESCRVIDLKISSGQIEGCEECLRLSFERPPEKVCLHAMTELCVGMEIRMPWVLIVAVLCSHKYEAPMNMCLHQMFCEGPHDDCF